MAERIGKVISSEAGGWAQVVTKRQGACGGCQSNAVGCRSCLTIAQVVSRVGNPVEAQPGDLVTISLNSKDLFKGAALFYLVPTVALMVGTIFGSWAGTFINLSSTAGAISGGLTGLVAALALVVRVARHPRAVQRWTPVITNVVEPGDQSPIGASQAYPSCH